MDSQRFGVLRKSSMVDIAAIDAFLASALRDLRNGGTVSWQRDLTTDQSQDAALSAVWSRIDIHGIAAVLHHDTGLLREWPPTLLDRIAEEARLLGIWEMTHAAAVSQLIERLESAGIATVLMKGTALAYSIYDDPSMRRRGDSDLLIRPADLEAARALLAESGWYRNDDPHGLTFQEGWLHDSAGHFVHALDLHWAVSDRPVLQNVLRVEDFFAHRSALTRLAPSAFRADHALTMIHSAINQEWHVAHGYWAEKGRVKDARRLIWALDFDLLARAMKAENWDRLVSLSISCGVSPLVADGLADAASKFDAPVPLDVLEALEKEPLAPNLAAYFAAGDKLSEFWLDLRTASSWTDRMTMVKTRAFPPRKHLVEKFPQQANWPTIALQALLIVETSKRLIKRAVVR